MLTLANSNTTQAKTYYKKENYYSQKDAEVNSQWQGQGASNHQLSGAIVDMDVYDHIVNGLSPDGKTQLREKQNHKGKSERAGIDLTFSAPKSVSIACLVGGDTRLEEAHRIAVSRTIDLIESRYATTRINKQPVKTDNLIVAKWHHDTSRELDPHLHTHCLVMNCTQGPDGKWRSISNKPFYQNKILLGQIYRNELALECRKLGYEIEPHPKELFEIKGYTRKQIEGFSKRHEQILNKLVEIGVELTTENKIWAWRKTRAKKNHEIGRDEKLPYWQEEADLYGIVTHPIGVPPQATVQSVSKEAEEIASVIEGAVTVGIEHCSERRVAFRNEDIEKFVTAEVKPFSIHELESAIAQHPELIKTFDGRYTTQKALARELATIKLMQEGKGQAKAIACLETINTYLEGKSLTSGQRDAIALSATTTDQFIAWQGVAGAGKTYALNGVKQLATALNDVAPGYTIKGFAPSAEAAKVLGEELGIEASTVASLLVSKQKEDVEPNQIWIVDEAGLLGAENAYSLLQRAKADGARVILVGDTRQLSAIEAGNPFKSLQSAGIATVHLNESLRQKPPQLQRAVSLATAGQMTEAISYLEQLHCIEEVVDVSERATRIATDYIKLSPEERQQTLIIAGTHKERKEIAGEIRTALKAEGSLGYSVEATQLRAKQNLTSIQTRYTHNYTVGDVVVPVRDYKKLKLFKSQPYTVVAIDKDKLVLSDLAGNHQTVDPMKFRKTLYQQENIEIAVGDSLKWTRNDKELGRRNGQEFVIIAIEGQTALVESENGKTNTINLYEPLHLDYALVSTTYSSQGKTADRVLVSSTVDPTVSQESVYVAISRAKYDLKIYAEDIDYLLEQAQESKANETVLELLQPKVKVQVTAEPSAAVTSSLEQSVGVPATSKVTVEDSPSVSNIERPLKRPNQKAALLTRTPIVKREPPKQLKVFWQPKGAGEAPRHIEAKHWHELVKSSAIHPDIAAANFRSLQMGSIEQEHQAWEYLMYSQKLERTNTGQLTTGMLKRYAHIDAGGWWCDSGVNAISFPSLAATTKPQEKRWGCYKPNEPRSNPDKPGKKIKYEHPPKVDLGIFLLYVPDEIAQKIYAKAGIDPNSEDRMRGFWYCTWKYSLPITITEGAKKAASLLSQGHAAIGLPGIYAGYRSKDEQGNPIKAHLHEELAVFATLGRDITFCFDYETRPETKRNIEIAISRTGSLLQQQGAKVNVVSLPRPEKGVDDLIVAHSPLAYEQVASVALPLRQWREHNKQSRHLAIVPPKKLSSQQRKEQLKERSSGQHPINKPNLNQLQESDYDSPQRQINREYSADRHSSIDQSLSPVDQKDRSVGENWHPTYEQQQSTEQTNYSLGNYSNGESGRIESQPSELLTAISRHLELQTVEQIGADITELDRSLANGFLSTEGTEQASRIIAHQSEIPQQVEQSKTTEHLAQPGERNDGRHSNTQCDRQLDSQHRGVESSEHRSLTGEQRTQELHPQTVDRQPLGDEANAQRLHRSVQRSLGETEVGQTERDFGRISHSDEQSLSQTGGYQPSTSPSQRAGDGSLRPDNGQEANSDQRAELALPVDGQWTQAVEELAQSAQSVNERRILGNAGLLHQLASLSEQINTLARPTKQYEFAGLEELAQDLTEQQALDELGQNLIALPLIGQGLIATNQLQQTTSSTLISDLQPHIQDLAQTITTWHSQVEIANASAKTSELIQQLKQRQTFDFGELPQILGQLNAERLLVQTGLGERLTSLTGQLTQLVAPAPTVFTGMDAIAENLLSPQAQPQLLNTQLIEGVSAFAKQVTDLNPKKNAHEYKFEGSAALGELAQTLTSLNTGQQLLEDGLLEKLQQTTSKAIAAISQHIKQSLEDLNMLQTANKTKILKQPTEEITAYKQETVTELIRQLRDLPLDEIAIRLGLTQDKYDKHKWRGEGQIISINDQKFYDHANLTGGYGAIDLVMHVQAREFKAALQWLANSTLELPPVPRRSPQPQPQAQERQPFGPPTPDESKWLAVRQYLIQKRQLPVALVEQLHSQGNIYADAKQNAVFLRQDIEGNLSGASLRGTYKDSSFKDLATGSQREGGWFSLVQGEGQLERIVLVESAIDALSAAALAAEQPGRTMFVSTDGAGSVPTSWLRQQQQQGVEIVAAHDSDRPGEDMAWRLAAELGSVTRATPTVGKDWNEQLKGIGSQPDVSQWKLVAQAIGKPDAYISRIEAAVASGQGLSTEAAAAMRLDFDTYKQTASDLWQWYQAAREIGRPDAYLGRIAEVAIAFHHPKSPTPLTQQAAATMQQDLLQHEQLLTSSLWQHDNPITDLTRPMKTDSVVAHTAAKDSSNPQQERLNTRALKLSIRLLSEFAKNQRSDCVSWTGGRYTFTKVGSDIKIGCSQRQSTILELTNGNLQGSITQRDVEKFEKVLEAIKEKEIGRQPEL